MLLSLEDWRIWYKEVDTSTEILDTTSPNDRGLEILDTIESMLELYIIDDPKSNVYPRPVDLVDILNDKKSNLKAMVASFDDSKEIKGVEVH